MHEKHSLNSVTLADGIAAIKEFDEACVHLILSDIPYGISADEWDVLHNNTNSALLGSSPAQIRAGAVFKRRGKPLNGWSEADRQIPAEYQGWCASFASEWLRVLKPGGSALVFAGRRLSHRAVSGMVAAARRPMVERTSNGKHRSHLSCLKLARLRVGSLRLALGCLWENALAIPLAHFRCSRLRPGLWV